jgi:AcrR family transcriptional regulator
MEYPYSVSRKKTPKAALLQASLDAMLDGRFTMGGVARRAGVSRQTLYAHFGSLGELAVQTARYVDEVEDVAGHLAPVHAASTPGAFLDVLAGFYSAYNPRIARIVRSSEHAAQKSPELQAANDDRRQARLAACGGVYDRLAGWGALRPGLEREATAQWIVSVGSVPLFHEQTVEGGWSAEQYRDHMAATLRRFLLADPDCA